MKTSKKENFLLIENDTDSLTDFVSGLTKHHNDFKSENLVVDLRRYNEANAESLLAFLEISNVHRGENKSFVLVNDAVGIDELPEELVVVPTLQEAEDMIQMDEIQRDLGF
ncbi:ribonuclease Z [Christiangramia sp. SM2212]|uniref:Ribonuclease Z n=1 Tax=Christiangramia sediminicola TaxID=3073267 RepID=A0ABU1EUC8_9FLAO|nr:ribonuclease Z [Christiangramia sp. SM2212]MDR5591997.1 ribonuclease Z [Christiangramia sp. SM2212]